MGQPPVAKTIFNSFPQPIAVKKMAFDVVSVAATLAFLLALAALLTCIVFPLVLVASFAYSSLAAAHEKTPKFVLMLLVTFATIFVVLAFLEIYLGNALTQILSLQCA